MPQRSNLGYRDMPKREHCSGRGISSGRLPDFIGVGPPRTGTTWLHEVLKTQVGVPAGIKETHFFTLHYDKGLAWYQAHFYKCPVNRPIGEFCPSYFDSPEARGLIARHIPRCKIICTLREPAGRLYSQYRMLR